MRALEWLVFVTFIPVVLLPGRRRWFIVSALLPVIMIGLHGVIEGWRVQMLPVYGLAVLVLIFRLPVLFGYEGTVQQGRRLAVSVVLALLLVGSGVGAGWLLPVVTLPEPTGPYSVGIMDHELVDEGRGRRLMASVWYPAAQAGTPAPLTHYPDQVATALGNLSGLPAPAYHHLRYFKLNASEGVPVLERSTPFPVLVFSHGMVGLRLQNSSTLQELASWGYIVVALDHTDAAAVTVFPDGESVFYDLARFGVPTDIEPNIALMNEFVFPVWVADQQFVYDTLEVWAVADPLLAGKIDLTRIGSFGHSFGGATALEVCRVDSRCRAAVNMDGALYGDTASHPAVSPLLLMTSAESSRFLETMEAWAHLIENSEAPAYWLQVPDSSHFSFTITQLLSPILVPDHYDPRAGLRVMDKYLNVFFNQYLRGETTIPLGAESGESDVRWLG